MYFKTEKLATNKVFTGGVLGLSATFWFGNSFLEAGLWGILIRQQIWQLSMNQNELGPMDV